MIYKAQSFNQSKSDHKTLFPVVGFLTDTEIIELQNILKVKINYPGYYEQALLHRSYLPVLKNDELNSNERMEFLGDSILGFVVTKFLFDEFSDKSEGELTQLRINFISRNSLTYCGSQLGLEKYIRMSYSAQNTLGSGSDSIISNAVESIIAAIFLDSNLEETEKFIIGILLPIIRLNKSLYNNNFKSSLLELSQSIGYSAPIYKVLKEQGPSHNKLYTIGVYADEDFLGTGEGKTKKTAEQNAAKNALDLPIFKKGQK